MHNRSQFLIYDLLTLVNSAAKETNEILIARALLENRHVIRTISMDDLSKKYYVSQAGITRFIKRLGYPDFRSFRQAMELSDAFLSGRYAPPEAESAEEAMHAVADEFADVAALMQAQSPKMYARINSLLKRYDHICFMGSDVAMSMLRLVQMNLIAKGKTCYAEYRHELQAETLDRAGENTLVIPVSVGGRWLNSMDSRGFRNCDGYTLLLVQEGESYRREDFDEVIVYAPQQRNDIAYYCFLYFVQTLNRII